MSPETLDAVLRASRRSAALVHEDMRAGLGSLAAVAYLAPWFGVLATVLTIPESFIGCAGERSTCMAAVVIRLSRSIWPAAIGLMIGLISAWSSRYLTGKLEGLDSAMEGASLDLVNQLSGYRGPWSLGSRIQRSPDGPTFGAPAARPEVWCHSALQTSATLAGAWLIQAVRYFCQDYLPLASVPWAACKYVALIFLLAFIPAYLLRAKLPDRRPIGLVDLAAAICLFWCLAEVIWSYLR